MSGAAVEVEEAGESEIRRKKENRGRCFWPKTDHKKPDGRDMRETRDEKHSARK